MVRIIIHRRWHRAHRTRKLAKNQQIIVGPLVVALVGEFALINVVRKSTTTWWRPLHPAQAPRTRPIRFADLDTAKAQQHNDFPTSPITTGRDGVLPICGSSQES
ncbi:hypothetical protein CH254_14470 [Rhodococcus sp. 06-412-2C]|nr:hypothetical protein CH254_14470 [Rhodococcus sp. 06-412-2C]OZC96410.1 hypothetical protein CH279_14640 [Rhodococcus sp. 06-412-2B]